MRAVLITLIGPDHTSDLAVDAETPTRRLLADLLGAVGVDAGAEDLDGWTVALTGREPLDPHRTLDEAGVLDGAVLVLRRGAPPARPVGRSVSSPRGPAGSPLRRTRELLEDGSEERPRRLRRGSPREVSLTPETRISALEHLITDTSRTGCLTVAVASPKGGVGKTTVSILLGEVLSSLRSETVVALDGDSDYGSLGRVGTLQTGAAGDRDAGGVFSRLAQGPMTFAELDRTLWQLPDGLRVVPSPRDAAAMARADRASYTRVLGNVQRLAGVLVVDCGTGIGQPGAQAALLSCDQLVLVTDASGASASLAVEAFDLLARMGRPIIVVGNRLRRGRAGGDDLARLDASFPRAAGLVGIPEDVDAGRALGGELEMSTASRALRLRVLELAAALIAGRRPVDPGPVPADPGTPEPGG